MKDVLIIGAGPAGLTAALYAVRYGLSVTVFGSAGYGGQIAVTPEIENYPAIASITGFDFATALLEQTKSLGAELVDTMVSEVRIEGSEKICVASSTAYKGRALIVATGAKPRLLGCEGEERFLGRGVSYCATCDGNFFRGKTVAVIGGGNTALEDATFLSNICKSVYLIHRRNEFRASAAEIKKLAAHANIIPVMESTVTAIEGDARVNAVLLNGREGERRIELDGVFIAVGSAPDTSLVKELLTLDKGGYISAGEDCVTSREGVFAAGDCRTKPLRQVVTATADGATAAFMAASYLG